VQVVGDRYKHTMLVDLHNISMSMLMGKKKNLMKKVSIAVYLSSTILYNFFKDYLTLLVSCSDF
jgi:hypothetical protein